MTRLIQILCLVLAGCSNPPLTAPSTPAIGRGASLLDPNGPTTDPPVIGGSCDWRNLQVAAYVDQTCGGRVQNGCLGPHWLSNGKGVFLDEWNAGTTYRITDYPDKWCFDGASVTGRATLVNAR